MMRKYGFFLIVCAFLCVGCGRNTDFGVVDMQKVEKNASQLVTIREEGMAELKKIEDEMGKALKGKKGKEYDALVSEYQARAQIVQSNVLNKLRNRLEGAVHQVALKKKLGAVLMKAVVPDGGVDITDQVMEQLK